MKTTNKEVKNNKMGVGYIVFLTIATMVVMVITSAFIAHDNWLGSAIFSPLCFFFACCLIQEVGVVNKEYLTK